jgi:hypothetical protein
VALVLMVRAKPPLPPELERARQQQLAPSPAAGAPGTPAGPAAGAQTVQPLRQQVDDLHRAAQQGLSGSFRLLVTEDELNRQLARSGAGSPIQGAAVAILDGEVDATATVRIGGAPVQVLVRGQPRMEGNRPRIVVTEARMGRLPVPGEGRARLQAELDRAVDRAVAEARSAHLTGLTAQRGLLVVEGYLPGRGQ